MDVEAKPEEGQETKDETMAEVGNDDDDDNDADRVVREIDVFFTPQIVPALRYANTKNIMFIYMYAHICMCLSVPYFAVGDSWFFFSPQLYVLQYPLRPCWRPYDMDERCEEVRIVCFSV